MHCALNWQWCQEFGFFKGPELPLRETGIPSMPKQKGGKSTIDYWLGQGTYRQLCDWELNETNQGLGNSLCSSQYHHRACDLTWVE